MVKLQMNFVWEKATNFTAFMITYRLYNNDLNALAFSIDSTDKASFIMNLYCYNGSHIQRFVCQLAPLGLCLSYAGWVNYDSPTIADWRLTYHSALKSSRNPK